MTFEPIIESVRGYRVFEVSGAYLRSYSADYVWEPGWNAAACRRRTKGAAKHDAPAPGCTCGFWVYRTLARAAKQFRAELGMEVGDSPFGDFDGARGVVLGRVLIAGHLVEGTDGWRAERAGIEAVYTDDPELIGPLVNRYGVSVEPSAEIAWPVRGLLTELRDVQLRVLILDGDRKFGFETLCVERGSAQYLEAMTLLGEEVEVVYERIGDERWVTRIAQQR